MVGLTQLTTPREWSTIRVTDPVGVKGRRGSRLRGHGFKGLNVKGFKNLQVLGLQGSQGSRVNCEVKCLRRPLKVDGFKISNTGFSAFRWSKGFKTCRDISVIYPQGIKGTSVGYLCSPCTAVHMPVSCSPVCGRLPPRK